MLLRRLDRGSLLSYRIVVVIAAWFVARVSRPMLEGDRARPGPAPIRERRARQPGRRADPAETRANAVRALATSTRRSGFSGWTVAPRRGRRAVGAARRRPRRDDTTLRVHRFRARARAAVGQLSRRDRARLTAYTAGVNAGLAALGARPFEYAVLRQAPAPWREEDTFLVAYAMFLDLQRGGLDDELETLRERTALPVAVRRFLDPAGDAWDAPLVGDAITPPGIPPPDSLGGYRPGAVAPGGRPRLRRADPLRARSRPARTTGPSPAAARRPAAPSWPTTCTSGCACRTSGSAPR